jgi:hypothetical protein
LLAVIPLIIYDGKLPTVVMLVCEIPKLIASGVASKSLRLKGPFPEIELRMLVNGYSGAILCFGSHWS